MKKLYIFIISSIVFVSAFGYKIVFADTVDKMYMVMTTFNPYTGFIYLINENSYLEITSTQYILHGYTSWYAKNGERGMSVDEVLAYTISQENTAPTMPPINNNAVTTFKISEFPLFICSAPIVSGTPPETGFFASLEEYEEYINPTPEPPSWWEIISDQVIDWFGTLGEGAEQIWTDFVDWVNGESSHGGGHAFNLVSPTPRPTVAPTPTLPPYTIQVVPTTDPVTGDTIYQYQYKYDNPQGTPIITSAPPSYPSGSGDTTINVNGFEYPYYDNPENKDNPYQLDLPWYLKIVTGNSEIDESQLEDAVDLADNYINSENTSNGINAVYDSMTAFPTDLIALIGLLAAIPLIGALIHRLLG